MLHAHPSPGDELPPREPATSCGSTSSRGRRGGPRRGLDRGALSVPLPSPCASGPVTTAAAFNILTCKSEDQTHAGKVSEFISDTDFSRGRGRAATRPEGPALAATGQAGAEV